MYTLEVPCMVNGKEEMRSEIVYNINDYPYNDLYTLTIGNYSRKRGRTKESIAYINLPCAFDIESTTIRKADIGGVKVVKDEFGHVKIKNDKKRDIFEKRENDSEISYYGEAFMYHWQLCVSTYVVFGRTWKEFQTLLTAMREKFHLNSTHRLVIYIHNLAYEFQFLKDIVHISEIFAKSSHKVMKCYLPDFGIELRCSYFLSNMSFAKFCENTEGVIHYKIENGLDYDILRTPSTPLTKTELGYCYNDVRGLCECIAAKMKDDNLAEIPLTSTGYVRRDFRKALQSDKNYYRSGFLSMKLDSATYRLCKMAFRGGNTHANRKHALQLITAKVGESAIVMGSMDISSSYPAQIAMQYYPMSEFRPIVGCETMSERTLDIACEKNCVLMLLECEGIQLRTDREIPVPYLSKDKCNRNQPIGKFDNGRVLSIESATLALTEIDYKIIKSQYTIDSMYIKEVYTAKRGKLPVSLRNCMMDYFYKKSTLKGIPGKEYEYMKSKNKLNSTYGMMVTDIAHSDWSVNASGEWSETRPDLQEALDKYYKSKSNVLEYQWGIYVTAHARKQLQDMLDIVGDDVVYCDTDSIKFIHPEKHIPEFESKNNELTKRAIENDIPAYCKVGEHRYILGVWDLDDMYIQFKTIGAKKYCGIEWNPKALEKGKDPCKFNVTVAGLGKENGRNYFKTPTNFKLESVVEDSGRSLVKYNESEPHYCIIGDEKIYTASNVGIIPTTYTLGVTDEYNGLITEILEKLTEAMKRRETK